MATYTWHFGSATAGLQFTILYDDATSEFTVTSLLGSFDLNALWFSDGNTTSDGYVLVKSDNNLNMNGANTVWDDGTSSAQLIVWDDYSKLSSPGLGSEGTNKISFINDGETQTFTLSDFGLTTFDPTNFDTLGVRATSVNGNGSIKWADLTPEVQQGHGACVTTLVNLTNNTPVSETLSDISGDGCFVTYAAPGSGGDFDVFWKNIETGEVKIVNAGAGDQTDPHISADGQHVSYTSDNGAPEIRLWEATGVDVSVPSTGLAFLSDISDDGAHVVYTQVSGAGAQIGVWDSTTGDTTIVAGGNQRSNPSISGDGQWVVFEDRSFSADPSESEIVMSEVGTGTSIRVTTNSLQGTQMQDTSPDISADGNYVVFQGCSTSGTNCDIFVFERATLTLTNVSASVAGEARSPDVSGDGRYVVFSATVAGETDIFVWDRTTQETAEIDLSGVQRNPSISANGQTIAFESDQGGQFDLMAMPNPLFDGLFV